MKLIQNYLTNNECYKKGIKIKPKGGMLHSTGANNPNLKRYVQPNIEGIGNNSNGNHWNQHRPDGRQVCVHGFIGKLEDGSIATVQTLPWDCRGWHAGKAKGNDEYLGIEICEDGLDDVNYFNAVYQEAVETFAFLAIMFNWNPLTDIICHSEGYKKGIASNHADVMHWFPKYGKSMDTFRTDVKAKMDNTTAVSTPSDIKAHVTVTANTLNIRAGASTKYKIVGYAKKGGEYDVFEIVENWGRINGGWISLKYTTYNASSKSYKVKITASVLNVRAGAGTNYKVNTTIRKNEVYTIVDEKNGWGKLKSGAGWIKLSYTNKV